MVRAMTHRLAGYHVRYLEPEALRAFLRGDGATPGRRFLASFDASAWTTAVNATTDAGTLDDAAACALADAVLRAGEPGGFIDTDGADEDGVAFATTDALTKVLGDATAGERLLTGGLLDRIGVGRHALGSLPVRVLVQQLDQKALDLARREAQAAWLSELLNTLESAKAVAGRTPEAHLVLVPEWTRVDAEPGEPDEAPRSSHDDGEGPEPFPLVEMLRDAASLGATDLVFVAGAPPTVFGPSGRQPLRPARLAPEDTRRLAFSFLSDRQVERFEREGTLVTGFGVRGVGRYRLALTLERGVVGASLRVLPSRPPALDHLALPERFTRALTNLERGLIVVGGTPGSGRSTTLAALCQALLDSGATLASVEEPIAFPLNTVAGLARQVDAAEDAPAAAAARALRLGPIDALAVDLLDEALACELALDAAAEGRLALLVLRGATVTALVHQLVAADAKLQRRRLSETLAAVLCQTLVPNDAGDGWDVEAEALVPSEALRRHLRALDTMPPPAVLEPEDDGVA